jgi:hypothetical protein
MNRDMKASINSPDTGLERTESSRIKKIKHKTKTGYTWPVFDLLGHLDVALWSDDFTIVRETQGTRIRKRKFSKLRAKTSFLKTLMEDLLASERDAGNERTQRDGFVKEAFEEGHAEADIIEQLVKHVSELEPRDARFTQILMREVQGPFSRAFLYLFLPLAAYDFIKVRSNIDALRRLRDGAAAYRAYSELVRSYLFQALEDRQIVREAFLGVMNLRNSRQKLPLIRAKIVHAIREFADWADQYLSARHMDSVLIDDIYHDLYEDSEEAIANRNQIVNLATESYIRDQVFRRIECMVMFAGNMKRFNPFTRLPLV